MKPHSIYNPKRFGFISKKQLVEHATQAGYNETEAAGAWEILVDLVVPEASNSDANQRRLGRFALEINNEVLIDGNAVNVLLGLPYADQLDSVQHQITLEFILEREKFVVGAQT